MRLAGLVASVALVLFCAGSARADDAPAPAPAKGTRAAVKDRIRDHAKDLTPEQRAKLRARVEERLKNLTPEQRAKLRERCGAQGK